MFIDIHVLPAFYEPINGDERKEELRHEALDIHLNGIAKIQHIKNQMKCAGLDKMALLAQDYTSELGEPVVSNDEVRTLVDCEPDRFIGIASVDPKCEGAADELERAFAEHAADIAEDELGPDAENLPNVLKVKEIAAAECAADGDDLLCHENRPP